MSDRVYTDGFPDRWSMVHRDDCTLLVRSADRGFLVVPSQAVCMAPKLAQGEAWLETAKEIAHALEGSHRQELDRIFAEFCDSCGIGPPHDEDDQPRRNVRALRTWTCDRCDHVNARPKADAIPSPSPTVQVKCVPCNGVGIRYVRHETDYASGATETCTVCAGKGTTPALKPDVRDSIADVREALTDPTIASYPDFVAAVSALLDDLEKRHAQAPLSNVAPEGWQLVPTEPTAFMIAEAICCDWRRGDDTIRNIWRHMLAAVPSPSPNLNGERP